MGPSSAAISSRSAPAEKNRLFPAMTSGHGWLLSCPIASVRDQHTSKRQAVGAICELKAQNADALALFDLENSSIWKARQTRRRNYESQICKEDLGTSFHPLRQAAAVFFQHESSHPEALPTMRCDSGSRAARVIHCWPTRYCAAVNHFWGSTSTRPPANKDEQRERRIVVGHRLVAGRHDQFVHSCNSAGHLDFVRARSERERYFEIGRSERVAA